jgi:hypothetical protein
MRVSMPYKWRKLSSISTTDCHIVLLAFQYRQKLVTMSPIRPCSHTLRSDLPMQSQSIKNLLNSSVAQ